MDDASSSSSGPTLERAPEEGEGIGDRQRRVMNQGVALFFCNKTQTGWSGVGRRKIEHGESVRDIIQQRLRASEGAGGREQTNALAAPKFLHGVCPN